MALATEWDLLASSQQALKQQYIPLTSLCSRAADIAAEDAAGITTTRDYIVDLALRYLQTDTLLCWAPETDDARPSYMQAERGGQTLYGLQKAVAEPIIEYLSANVFSTPSRVIKFKPALEGNSLFPSPQPEATTEAVRTWLYKLPAYELAGIERGTLATKSLLIAIRLIAEWSPLFNRPAHTGSSPPFGVDEAAAAACVEVDWQTQMWGEVDDTHDVDREDLRRQLGSIILLVS